MVSSSSPSPCTTQAPVRAVEPQRGEHPLGDRRVGHADQLAAHPARVGHRPEQVEHRGDADLAARRARRSGTTGGSAGRGRSRCRPRSTQRVTPSGGSSMRHAERLEHVGRAALRRRRPRAVLAHRHPGAGHDDRGHRRDVDRVAAVATGADDVDRPVALLVRRAARSSAAAEHGVEQAGQLLGRLALGPQGHDEADQLGRRGVAGEDRRHRRAGLRRRVRSRPVEQLGRAAPASRRASSRVRARREADSGRSRQARTPRRVRPRVPTSRRRVRRCGDAGG